MSSPLFMIGNLKFSACLLVISLIAFSSSYFFQKNLGQSAVAEEMKNSGGIVLGATDSQVDDHQDSRTTAKTILSSSPTKMSS